MSESFRDRLNQTKPTLVFLIIALLIGGYIRLSPVLNAEVPINDGGMFLVMSEELVENGFALPELTGYNRLNIPYAYPPLAFYLTGILHQTMGWAFIDIIRILPAVFTIFAIVAFYFLAEEMLEDESQKIIAILMFAFIPSTFDWVIMGGGLTRSTGFFFSILATRSIYRLYKRDNKVDIFWTALFSALTVLSHPEAALQTAVTAFIFFAFFGRNKTGIIRSLIVAVAVLALTSYWWVSVISRHGISTFFTAGNTGFFEVSQIFQFFNFVITHEPGLQIMGVLALIGLFWCIAKKQYLLPVWLVVRFLSEPRSAPLHSSYVMVMMASFALIGILNIFNQGNKKENSQQELTFLDSWAAKGIFFLFFGSWIYSAWLTVLSLLGGLILTPADLDAFEWVKENTPMDSQVLVLTTNSPFSDPVAEWFPVLAERKSIVTVQGHEWDENVSFEVFFVASTQAQKCFSQNYTCIDEWADENDQAFDYIYIHNPVKTGEDIVYTTALGESMEISGAAKLVYQIDEVTVYQMLDE